MKMQRKVPSYRPLTLESLESRRPLAGDVALKVSGGNLTVKGDDGDNLISIVQQPVAGVFKVNALGGETLTLNGQTYVSGTDIPNITKNITVDMKKGNDTVDLVGQGVGGAATAGNVTINTKAGADVVTIVDANITGNVKVNTSAGDAATDGDDVTLNRVKIGKNLSVLTGKGNDTVVLEGAGSEVVGNASIKTGDADLVIGDTVLVLTTKVGKNLSIATGKGGGDFVEVNAGEVVGNATIKTGAANDTVQLTNQQFGKNLTVNTGNANVKGEQNPRNDTVVIEGGTTVAGNTSVKTGDGDDDLVIDNATLKKVTVKTGKGVDFVTIATLSFNPVTIDQALVDLGAGDDQVFIGATNLIDPLNLALLVVNGPKISVVKGGSGNDTITGADDVVGLNFLKDPLTTGVEVVNPNN